MGNTLINDLYDTGQLALDARFQMGTLIDRVSGNAATASGSSVAWGKGPKAQNGIVCTGTGILSFPDTVANRLATGSAEIIIIGNLWNLPDNSRLVSKRAASTSYDIYRISAASGYGLYDGVNSAQFTYLSAARMLVFSITNGSPAKLYADGAFAINGSANTTINSTNVALNIGNYSSGGTPLGAPITRVIEVVRNLTPAEHARLWDEYVAEGASPDLPRRNFVYYEQAREDSWYTAQGIVLDTDFVRRSDGKIRDNSPSNYAGTIAGIPSPGPNEQGLVCGLNDSINFGNVTQLFRVGTFTLDGWFLWSSTLVGAVYTHINWLDSTDNFAIYVSSSATTSTITVFLSNGTTASGTTSATVLRAGQKQHLAVVFNGTGVGNAGRLQVYVDGQPVTLSFSGTIPATTSNTLQPFYAGYVAGLNEPGTKLDMRLRTSALSAAQVRAVYLATGAQRLTLRETFEDVPVSLATVPVGGYLGPWRLASGAGTNVCSETADGKRWITTNNTAEWVYQAPQPDAFGTWRFFLCSHQINPLVLGFIADNALSFGASGPNGYGICLSAAGRIQLIVMTAGAVAANVMYSATGYITVDTLYEIVINRRPSDGQFTLWIKGGVYTNYTLVSTAGGGGTNPGADLTYVTSKAMCLQLINGDKVLMYDPNDRHVVLEHFVGVLDPTAGELL